MAALLQRLRHGVEIGVEQTELVLAFLADAVAEMTFGDLAQGLAKHAHRFGKPLGQHKHRQRHSQHGHQGQHHHQGDGEVGHLRHRFFGNAQEDQADAFVLKGDRRLKAQHGLARSFIARGADTAPGAGQGFARQHLVALPGLPRDAGRAHRARQVGQYQALEGAGLH